MMLLLLLLLLLLVMIMMFVIDNVIFGCAVELACDNCTHKFLEMWPIFSTQ